MGEPGSGTIKKIAWNEEFGSGEEGVWGEHMEGNAGEHESLHVGKRMCQREGPVDGESDEAMRFHFHDEK